MTISEEQIRQLENAQRCKGFAAAFATVISIGFWYMVFKPTINHTDYELIFCTIAAMMFTFITSWIIFSSLGIKEELEKVL